MTTENEHMNSFLVSVSVVHLIWKGGWLGGISESENFIWRYELISGFGLSCSPYLKKGGISESENFMWTYGLISGFGLSCSPHLKRGYIWIWTHIYWSATCGVAVFKASMLDWLQGLSAIGIYVHCSAMRCAKFGVAVFKASMLKWLGESNLPWVYMHCSLYIDLPSLV